MRAIRRRTALDIQKERYNVSKGTGRNAVLRSVLLITWKRCGRIKLCRFGKRRFLWDSFVRTSLVDICNVMNGGFSVVITPVICKVIHVFAVSARITA